MPQDQYKAPKLKLKKYKKEPVKVAKDSPSKPMSIKEPKGKLKIAPIKMKMVDEQSGTKPKGKIKKISKKGKPVIQDARDMKSFRRIELESQTESMMKEALKEAAERKRLQRAKKERQMIKRIK